MPVVVNIFLVILVVGISVIFDSSWRSILRSFFKDTLGVKVGRDGIIDEIRERVDRRNRRIEALKTAHDYLKPYKAIDGDLTLSNKNCTIILRAKEKSIFCVSKEAGRQSCFTAHDFHGFIDADEYFDSLCESFSHNITYYNVLVTLKQIATVSETDLGQKEKPATQALLKAVPEYTGEIIDINNCSEAELTALPGVSVIIAKKIVQFRDEKRPFKSPEDFFEKMDIKPHFRKQLEPMICTNKVNIKKYKKAQRERIIDF